MPAIQYTKTATSDAAWDGPANEANLKNDGDEAYYKKAFAWQDPDKSGDTKDSFRFIHHEVGSDGEVGAANLAACSTGIGVLNGGRTGTTIPEADKTGVHAHLAHHLEDAGRAAPELKSARGRRAWDTSEMPPHPHDDMVHEHAHRAADGSSYTHAHAHHHDDGSVGHESDAHDHEGAGDLMDGDEPVIGMGRSTQKHFPTPLISRGDGMDIKKLVFRQERSGVRGHGAERYPTHAVPGPVELRATAQGGPRIVGYAAVFDEPTIIDDYFGSYVEQCSQGCFSKTIREADVRGLFNHEVSWIMGRTKSGTLRLGTDSHGLHYEIDPPNSPMAQHLCEEISRGDIDGSSFGFRSIRDNWDTCPNPESDGDGEQMDRRQLLEVQLYDVSPVTFPAYPQTDASVRAALLAEGLDLDALPRIAMRFHRGLRITNRDREQLHAAMDYFRRFLPSESLAAPSAPARSGHPPTPQPAAPAPSSYAVRSLKERLQRIATAE